jgi:hypothetical protein
VVRARENRVQPTRGLARFRNLGKFTACIVARASNCRSKLRCATFDTVQVVEVWLDLSHQKISAPIRAAPLVWKSIFPLVDFHRQTAEHLRQGCVMDHEQLANLVEGPDGNFILVY